MDHTLGLAGIFMVGLITILIGLIRPRLLQVLLSAYTLRAGAAITHHYFFSLPDSQADATTFENQAWIWAQDGLIGAFSHFPGLNSSFYSWLMSFIYALFGRDQLLLQSLSVLVGVLCVYLCWRLGKDIWGNSIALKIAWVTALFPTLILYSSLVLREVYIVFFFLLALYFMDRSLKKKGILNSIGACLAFGTAGLFHGGMFLALFLYLGLMGFWSIRRTLNWYFKNRISSKSLMGGFLVIALFLAYIFTGFSVSKIGSAEQLLDSDRWLHVFESRNQGEAKYPDWVQPQIAKDLFWAIPLRPFYFLFSPLPSNIQSRSHLVGFFDAILYLSLFVTMWKNRKAIAKNTTPKYILAVLFPLIIAFSIGTGNFGTGVRHRAKFVCALIILAGPMIPRPRLHTSY